ncbi:hypothetical protein OPIT5_22165 [Opitutaceae bacterium TAV5]|nr:hypothetical protein OPIT5_22165 [Opitutaceae bacterium TAV5]
MKIKIPLPSVGRRTSWPLHPVDLDILRIARSGLPLRQYVENHPCGRNDASGKTMGKPSRHAALA